MCCLSASGTAITELLSTAWLKQQTVFLTVLGVRKSEIKVLTDPMCSEDHFLVDSCLLPMSSHGQERDHISYILSYKGTNPIPEGSTLMT